MDIDPTSPDTLSVFYSRLFPFKAISTWLQRDHKPGRVFRNREIAFTLRGDVYLRYQSFQDVDEFKKKVLHYNPVRFEIGPVYDSRPKDKKSGDKRTFRALERELVFDIDMTDYDPVRTCCSGADICKRCWQFIAAAAKVIDLSMRDQFGYKHLLWVYSGRRGIHLWVSDEEAFGLADDERRSMVNWLHVVSSGVVGSDKQVNVRSNSTKFGPGPLPPSLQLAVEQLSPYFSSLILQDQDCFGSEDGYNALLKLIPDQKVSRALQETWASDPNRSSEDKWEDLKTQVKKYPKGSVERAALAATMEDIILQYTYPRLDTEVTKHRNHLLKSPFCIHPKTGRVCVPVDPTTIDDFDPGKVPTVGQLLSELNSMMQTDSLEHHGDWEKTSLKPFVDILNKHNSMLLNDVRRATAPKPEVSLDW